MVRYGVSLMAYDISYASSVVNLLGKNIRISRNIWNEEEIILVGEMVLFVKYFDNKVS